MNVEGEIPSTIPALLAHSVAARRDNAAVATIGQTLSYAELERESARMARALLAAGAGKGTRIALLAPDGILWLTAFLGAARIGALVVCISTVSAPAELAHIVRNSDAQILIGARRYLRNDYAVRLEEAIPGLAAADSAALRLVAAPYLRSIWLDDADGLGWARSIEALTAGADSDGCDDRLLAAVEQEVAPSDEVAIIYTSGSTSLPKAVVHNQRTLACHSRVLADYFLIGPDERVMPLLPLFWIGGLTLAVETLAVGGCLAYPASPRIDDIIDAVERLEVGRINTWGPQLTKLRDAATTRGIDIGRIIGLGPWRQRDGVEIPPDRVSNLLGMSETFGLHSGEPMDSPLPEDKRGATGRAVGDYQRRVVDPDSGREVAVGEIGELHLRGAGLLTRFYKVDRAKTFTDDGYFPTNDLVRIDADGYLYFVSRRGDMLKTAGANVSRLEVEAALTALPDVAQAIVVGVPDDEAGELVMAAVVAVEATSPTEAQLKTALSNQLSNYKLPKRIILIGADEVLWTSTGKIRLAAMRDLIAERVARDRQVSPGARPIDSPTGQGKEVGLNAPDR